MLSQLTAKFSQDGPNMAQYAPKWIQMAPKSSEDSPKMAPTWHLMMLQPPHRESKNIDKTSVESTFSLRMVYVA